jgi:hypothetical protein
MTRLSPAVLAVGILSLGLLGMVLPEGPVRAAIVAGSVLLAPGIAIAGLGGVREPLVLALVAVPLSLSLIALVATAFVYVGVWSTELVYGLVAAMTIGAGVLGEHERPARAALLGLVTLPGLVLLAAELAASAR